MDGAPSFIRCGLAKPEDDEAESNGNPQEVINEQNTANG
jgi:hypothetical protein